MEMFSLVGHPVKYSMHESPRVAFIDQLLGVVVYLDTLAGVVWIRTASRNTIPASGMGSYSDTKGSFFTSLDFPIKAIACTGAADQLVAAGRNFLRIFQVGSDRFTEKEVIRFTKRFANCSCTDVAWNPNDEYTLAATTATGCVLLWNLGSNAASRQESQVFEHRRTANRICFHPKEPQYLLSGSQDASAVLFDLRKRDLHTAFRCEESVRDVQFSPHQSFHFAVCLENGNVQMFDMRKPDASFREFTCHTGPVFQSHFHPEDSNLVATCGRDRCIKVWNLTEIKNPTLEYLAPTVAPMGTIAWRPSRYHHLASAALMTDFSVAVWDLRRPYIPFATFDKHTDVISSLVWTPDPHVMLTGSKDGVLGRFSFNDAKRPADKVNPVGLSVGCFGDLAQACNKRLCESDYGAEIAKAFLPQKPQFQRTMADEFLLNSSSRLNVYPHDELKTLSMEWFVSCARNYQLQGASVADLCLHNAEVAETAGRMVVAQVWKLVATIYASTESRSKSAHPSGEARSGNMRLTDQRRDDSLISRQDDSTMPDSHSETGIHRLPTMSRVFAPKEPQSLALEPPNSTSVDFMFNEQTMFEESENPFGGMENTSDESMLRLPTEGFQLRTELPERSMRMELTSMSSNEIDRNRNRSGSIGFDDQQDDSMRFGQLNSPTSHLPSLDLTDLVHETILYHADRTDLQTAVSLICVLGDRIRNKFTEVLMETWFLDYIELLHQYQLFSVANEVIKLSQLTNVRDLNQQSTSIYTLCNNCSKLLHKAGWFCTNCKKLTSVCSLCQLPIRGLYVWCQGCAHGGHLEHMEDWFKKNAQCPTGCGHYCEFI